MEAGKCPFGRSRVTQREGGGGSLDAGLGPRHVLGRRFTGLHLSVDGRLQAWASEGGARSQDYNSSAPRLDLFACCLATVWPWLGVRLRCRC
ncbi:MAG: hypothetical protein Ct9H300mP7_6720 [Verrucomicrobiota bacterium]|nr:MAG: hypothetical protein Ct9H300mP7_6720 [Verrucomicrobiota bacterium]